MSHRAHIYVIQEQGGVYIRTQNLGSELPLLVQRTLRYMARHKMFYMDMRQDHRGEFFDPLAFPTAFTYLVADCHDKLHDLSIGWYVYDNEWPILIVDPTNLRLGTASPPPTNQPGAQQPLPADRDWVSFRWFLTDAVDKEILAWWEISKEAWQRNR